MDDGFLESLLVAVAAIVGDMAAPGSSSVASGSSPFAQSLGRLGDKPVALGPDEHQGIGAIRDAGYTPVQRDTLYREVARF